MVSQCLKLDKVIFNHKTEVNCYIVYEINVWLLRQSSDFTLGNSFFFFDVVC